MGWFDFSFSRRCIAVDLGQSRIKAILAERKGSRVEVLHGFTLDLQEEGLLTMEETNRHLSRILLEMGEYPISLAIPQHIAVSHLIALPPEGHGGWERMVKEETQKLIGLSESTIVYDYFRLNPFRRNRNPVWVTVSRERDLDVQIKRLQGSRLVVGEVTNAGNALASSYLATQPAEKRVVLVDVGAASTTVVILDGLQPVYATAFPFGGELFTEAMASARQTGFDEAETIKKTEFLFDGPGQLPEFVDAVESWHQQLQKVIGEWLKDQPDPAEEPVKVMLSGGVSLQPGFLEYLQKKPPLRYALWSDTAFGVDPQTYAVAYGAALSGLNLAPVSSSLLPKSLRQSRFQAKQVTVLNSLAALLLAGLFVLLVLDASVKHEALRERSAQVSDLNEAYEQSLMVTELLAQRDHQYQTAVPIVQQQKRTRDLLRTVGLMQAVRAEKDVWFVLLADGRSYLEETTGLPASSWSERETRNRGMLEPVARDGNPAPEEVWDRFILELSIPGNEWETHDRLREVVNSFASEPLFQNVDTLAAAERKQVVDPAVTLPNQTFSLDLELVPSEFSLPDPNETMGPFLNPGWGN